MIPRNFNDLIDDLLFTLKPVSLDIMALPVSKVVHWHQRGVKAYKRAHPEPKK